MPTLSKCEVCRKAEAVWAMQAMPGGLTFALLGSHYRGFQIVKVCEVCKVKMEKPHTVGVVGGTKIKFDHSLGRWVMRPYGMLAWFPLDDAVLPVLGVRETTDRFKWYDLFGRWAACVAGGEITDLKAASN